MQCVYGSVGCGLQMASLTKKVFSVKPSLHSVPSVLYSLWGGYTAISSDSHPGLTNNSTAQGVSQRLA